MKVLRSRSIGWKASKGKTRSYSEAGNKKYVERASATLTDINRNLLNLLRLHQTHSHAQQLEARAFAQSELERVERHFFSQTGKLCPFFRVTAFCASLSHSTTAARPDRFLG
jgi:hypothetical protein